MSNRAKYQETTVGDMAAMVFYRAYYSEVRTRYLKSSNVLFLGQSVQ